MTIPNLTLLDNIDGTEEVTPEVRVISEIKNYTDGEGRTIMGHYPIDGASPSFFGAFMVGTNMGPVRMSMDFPNTCDINDCFDMFDELAEKTVQKAQEEANQKSRIITPDQIKGNFKL